MYVTSKYKSNSSEWTGIDHNSHIQIERKYDKFDGANKIWNRWLSIAETHVCERFNVLFELIDAQIEFYES